MLIPPYCPKHIQVANIVARHKDAEIISEIIRSFDQMTLIRGSGAGGRKKNRGGTSAFRKAVRALGEGKCVAMTADVPPGPARIVGQGVIKIAQLSGRPILPVAAASSRFYVTRTWSRMTINFPFSRITLRIGAPIYIPADATETQLELLRLQVQTGLNQVTLKAYADVGANPLRTEPLKTIPSRVLPTNLKLIAYKTATQLCAIMAPIILKHRAKKGKEDASRKSEKLGVSTIKRPNGALTWIHAASVGETNAILPLMEGLHALHNNSKFLLTTGTVTSAQIAQERMFQGDIHQFAPLDTPQFITRFLDHWKPELAIMTESEIWPNIILSCHSRGIPVAVVNGRMSERSYRRWRRNQSIALPLFSRLHLVLAQNELMARKFRELGAHNVLNSGNIKIDAPKLPVDKIMYDKLASTLRDRPLWAAVSTHPGEDEKIIAAHNRLAMKFTGLLTIIAPRHPERSEKILSLAKSADIITVCRTRNEYPDPDTGLYIFDCIGELGLIYSLVQVAFIGGSLVKRGGQNPVEAVRFDTAVITGPHYGNFSDTYNALLKVGGALEVTNELELADIVNQLLLNKNSQHRDCVRAAQLVIEDLSGGIEKTISNLKLIMPENHKTQIECRRHAF
ncbi:MAG TPA: hypothetical protein TECP_00408 [Hyphomicrobiaceae bacterium MAG_BT-2024]